MLPVYLWLLPRWCFNCRISASSPSAKEQAALYKHHFLFSYATCARTHTHTIKNNNGVIPNKPLCSSL